MITLEQVSITLENLLNHSEDRPSYLMDYEFQVRTQGLLFSSIADMKTGKNFIPVFVGSLGGTINPVPNLEAVDYNIPISVYFPVRFKNDFFHLQDFLYKLFVGKTKQYGEDFALSNISIPQLGEIRSLGDIKEFQQWVNDTYRKEIVVNEVWLSLTFNLYLSSAKDLNTTGFLFGNEWQTYIYITEQNGGVQPTEILTDLDPVFVEITDNATTEPAAEQLLGTDYSKGIPTATSYARQITLYVKEGYKTIVDYYLKRKLQGLTFTMKDYCDKLDIEYERTYYIASCQLNKAKGQLMTMTFSLADKLGE